MTVPANRLFAAAPLESLFLAIESRIQKTIEAIETSLVANSSLNDIAKSLEVQFKLNLPSLNRDDVHISDQEDCKVDVRNDHSRNVSDRSKPCLVDGKRITVSVPFTGDAKLLMQNAKAPNAISAIATVEKDKIDLIYTRPLPLDNQLFERDIQNDIGAIDANLTFINSAITAFNRNLLPYILNKISDRKSAIEAGKDALRNISLPVRIKDKPIHRDNFTHTVQQPLNQKITGTKNLPTNGTNEYDVFICHASEDKKAVATPLANGLIEKGIKVWYDQLVLKIGDSLTKMIDEGLTKSRYGIVILSPAFFAKNWPQRELAGLTQKEMKDGTKVILPIWHNVTWDDVSNYSLPLADRVAGDTSDMDKLTKDILEVLAKVPSRPSTAYYDTPGSYLS